MTYLKYKNVMCVGAGGGLVYYAALFFHLLGSRLMCFDSGKNQRTEDLNKRGVTVAQANPGGDVNYHVDLVVYSSAVPKNLINSLKESNRRAGFVEAGEFTSKLLENYDEGRLTDSEKQAFLDSNVAPLYKLDLHDVPIVGVTGTDGKTTTCEMIYHLLNKSGFRPAVVTTVSAKCGEVEIDTGFHTTTPSAHELYTLLQKFIALHCTHIIVETTSHALAMGRVAGLRMDAAVVTNVTQDHFDYHKTWDNYIKAKSLLITKNLKDTGFVVLNRDDDKSYQYLSKVISKGQRVFTPAADNISVEDGRIKFEVEGVPVELNILGKYNVFNALCALSVCMGLRLGHSLPELCKYLADFKGVAGRMQIIQSKPFMIIVDFAHTPNALEKALTSVRSLTGDNGRVIAVFGCAGNRDALKRPLMGSVSKKFADVTILTAEDPRTEKVDSINSQIKKGWDGTQGIGKELILIDIDGVANRRQAIKKAVELARPGDVVIICGKGHEKSLCFGDTEYPWSDVEEATHLAS